MLEVSSFSPAAHSPNSPREGILQLKWSEGTDHYCPQRQFVTDSLTTAAISAVSANIHISHSPGDREPKTEAMSAPSPYYSTAVLTLGRAGPQVYVCQERANQCPKLQDFSPNLFISVLGTDSFTCLRLNWKFALFFLVLYLHTT